MIKPASQNTNMYLYIFQGQDCLYTQRVDDQSVIGVLEYNGGTDRNSTLSDGWNVSGNAIVYGEKTICQISDVDDDADTIDLSALDKRSLPRWNINRMVDRMLCILILQMISRDIFYIVPIRVPA